MDKLFDTVLELSWQAGLIALAVMAVRLVLRKKASRRALCMLWALVALRLLLPVSLTVESPVSLQAEEAPVSRAYHAMQEARTSAPEEAAPAPAESSGAAAAVVPTEPAAEPVTLRTFARWLPWIWVIGMGCMAAYMLLSFIWMRLTLRRAEHVRDNVYRCTQWSTPFVLGIIAPCIYVPESVSEEDLPQVLAHERCHIRRWDHVVKPFAFLLLAVNWFNPVLWAAYVLLGRDMENACDEMALKNADAAQRAAYSRALVSCAVQPKMAAVCPLAFGEVAVKERVKNVLGYKKPAIWAAVILVAAAVVIGVCLLTKPSYKNVGTLDAEKLFALRTPYVDNNSAVGAILDALGFRELGSSGADYGYAVHLSTDREPMGITVLYTYEGAVPQRSEERYRQIAMRGYIALALIDNAEWFSWQEHGADGTSNKADSTASDSLYPIVYPGYPDTARESAEGLQAYINMLQQWMKDGIMLYARAAGEQDRWAWNADFPDASDEITPWPTLTENDPCSVRAEDYGIVYNDTLPDWDTCALSYLCAYYLNADGAYAEAAMDVLARRYQQAPNTVTAYIKSLAGQQTPNGRGDASEVLLADISAWDLGDAAVDGSKMGRQVTQVVQGLSVQISGIHSYTEEKVVYDEYSSGSVIVYTVYPGATLDVMVAPTYDDSEGRTHGEYKLYMKNGDTIELFPQTGPFDLTNALGVCAEGAYLIRFVPYGGDYLTFNENGAGMVSVPAVKFTGSGYTMYILDDGGWERVTIPGLDGTPKVSGKNAEIWQSTYDTSARLSVVHLNAMTLDDAKSWAVDAAGKSFTLTESKQGDMSGMNTAQTMYWTCAFYGTDDDRFAVIKTYPLELTERLGYALNAMADTFTPLAAQSEGLTTTDTARLEVVRVTWETGETQTQYIPLTDAQVQTILSEKGTVQPEWHQVCATLHRSGEDDVRYWGTADYPVPPTVLKLLTEQGGYEFVTPEDFRGNMTSAKLEFYGGETYTAAQADLPALQKMLTNARPFGGASACWFTARLTVTFDDGRTVSVLKATDSCASFMFGSWNTAMVSDRENDQFWQIFGVTLEE